MGSFYTSDLRGFDKGFNLWDLGVAKMTGSNQALKEKMANLVEEAVKVKAKNPQMTDADVARQVLRDSFYREAMLQYPNSDLKLPPEDFPGKNKRAKKFLSPDQEKTAIGELYDQVARPPVTPEQVEQFLKNYQPLKKHIGEADYPRMLEATAPHAAAICFDVEAPFATASATSSVVAPVHRHTNISIAAFW